jgi:hypothetical protein
MKMNANKRKISLNIICSPKQKLEDKKLIETLNNSKTKKKLIIDFFDLSFINIYQ